MDWLIRALASATGGPPPFVLLDLLLFELVRSRGFSDEFRLCIEPFCWFAEAFEFVLVLDMVSEGFLIDSFMLLLRSTASFDDDGDGDVFESLTAVPFCCVTVDDEAAITGDFLAASVK